MAVISATDYRGIARNYSNARTTMLDSKGYLYNCVYSIVQSDDVTVNVDLLSPFWNTYLFNKVQAESTQGLLEAVRAINAHVLRETTFDDIDAYLTAGGVTVPQTWADLSAEVGYAITTRIDP